MARRRQAAATQGAESRAVAVVDIGSNSVRLVVYQALAQPGSLFNEKALAASAGGWSDRQTASEGRQAGADNIRRFARCPAR